MPEGWDGTTRDLDEVHYEISQKEDEMLYHEFIQRMNSNKKKMAGEVKSHKYSRRRLILFQRVGISRLRKWVREGSKEVEVDGSLSACLMVLADL
ncbi:protein GAMETE CELL DEFECTIVE 1, mitochondrial-like [Corylus avellana]|uniref:protein GAMETE CELL DEFECTIVE 1, mitochondrial-like n=1 Tax=Corylus avellana TaxID=13451 RepID=UPI00286D0352|nr:protein GAMETE CELL DEFECTIVE 1, mitochondrial-like [Corylus avellana]